MSLWDKDDYGYDRTFDYDGDGKLDFYEWCDELDFYSSPSEKEHDDEDDEDEVEYALALNGLDRDDLEYMDEDERREALEDAGLDPDDYDFD